MLQNLKKIFPWLIILVLLIILIWPKKENKSLGDESTIDSQLRVEESLVDSFSSSKEIIILKRDSSLQRLDTLEIESLVSILKENIKWYENKTFPPLSSISGDSLGMVTK